MREPSFTTRTAINAPKQILSRQTKSRPKRHQNHSINSRKGKHGFTGGRHAVLVLDDPDLHEKTFSGWFADRHGSGDQPEAMGRGRLHFKVISKVLSF